MTAEGPSRPSEPPRSVERALGDRLTELVALNRLAIELSGTLDRDEIVEIGLKVAVGGLGFERGLIVLVDPVAGTLTHGRAFGGSGELAALVGGVSIALDDPDALLAQLARADGPLLFRDVDADAHPPNRAFAAALGVRDFVGTPLLTQGRSVGILAVDDRRAGRGVEAGDGPVLHTVGNLIAGALESSRLYGELEAQNRVLEARVEERTRDLVRAMSEAQDARTVAEAANAAKSTFLSNVSHELRTPLTSIVGFAKLDRKRLDDVIFPLTPRDDPKVDRAVRQVSETLGIVEAEGLRLKGLIDDLLDLARIESGRFEFRADPVDLRAVVRQAVAATSSLYEVAGLPLEVAVADAVPAVTGDCGPARPGRHQPAVECREVHARRVGPLFRGSRRGRSRGRRRRYRLGYPARGSCPGLRAVPPVVGHAARWAEGHRPRSADLEADRRGARWPDVARERAWCGEHVLVRDPGGRYRADLTARSAGRSAPPSGSTVGQGSPSEPPRGSIEAPGRR